MNLLLKKTLTILVGILLSFTVLEIGLQTTEFIFKNIKEYKNKRIKQDNVINILCLGESTTDGQWPPILQKILDIKSKHIKFNIIDEGKGGTNTFFISQQIKSYLEKYQPDCIILMMGINDKGLPYIKKNIKILNLFQLIYKHVKNKYFYNYTDETFTALIELARNLINQKKYRESEIILSFLLDKSNNTSEQTFLSLMELYVESKQFDKFKNLIDKYNGCIIPPILYSIEEFFLDQGYSKEKIRNWLLRNEKRLINEDSMLDPIFKKYDCLYLSDKIKHHRICEQVLVKKTILNQNNTQTKQNYINTIDYIYEFNKKILIMPMQYPTLSVENLKEILKDSKYYDNFVFISNEENFTQALKTHKREEIFRDNFGESFGQNFGHCTELGNTIIAENAAKTILDQYQK